MVQKAVASAQRKWILKVAAEGEVAVKIAVGLMGLP